MLTLISNAVDSEIGEVSIKECNKSTQKSKFYLIMKLKFLLGNLHYYSILHVI